MCYNISVKSSTPQPVSNESSPVKTEIVDWLLEKENPSVRYFTLIDILGRGLEAAEVREAREGIMRESIVPRILEKQAEGGWWGIPGDFYIRSKYRGTVWQFIILAELGASGDDERIRRACEFILSHSQDSQSGGFAYLSGKGGGGDHEKVLPCLTGNMLFSLLRFGYFEDPRVQQGLDWLVRYHRTDDGDGDAPRGWPYDRYEKCWGKHTCLMGVTRTLKALAEVPAERRTRDIASATEELAEYVLKHHVYRRSHDTSQVANDKWLTLGFPVLWEMDILDALDILTRLGCRDARLQEAVDFVRSKRGADGRWSLERTWNGRFLVNIERKDMPSKWVTLNALRVLRRLGG